VLFAFVQAWLIKIPL
jgi:hypothetical protein